MISNIRSVSAALIIAISRSLPTLTPDKPKARKGLCSLPAPQAASDCALQKRLAAEGHFVYAGARKQEDIDRLNKMDNVEAIRLDVTVQDVITAAAEYIRNAGRGLWGLINNAGVAIGGPITEVDVEETEWLFDVNVFGVYRVTQAFAPLIIESAGRISTIGSISGIGSGPFMSHYSMSKHAVEAFTDSLAAEMKRFDVGVSIIEPGSYDSKISENALKRIQGRDYVAAESPYAEDMKAFLSMRTDRSHFKQPDEVADAAVHALFSDKPKRRYMTVPNEDEARWAIRSMIQETVQMNEWQAYSFSREELIAMLDEAMQ